MNPRIASWRGKRVWIIGASSGIGAETARQLMRDGAHVALSARNAPALQALAAFHAESMVLPMDVTNHAQVLAARNSLLAAWGRIDLALIVAGGHIDMRADSFDLGAAKRLVDLNIVGVLHCLDAVLPVLLKQGHGGIGIVSSVAGYSGLPRALIYGPTKAALINLAESLYLDLAPRGIAVHLINPGFVDTPLTANNDFPMPALMTPADAAGALLRGIEAGRFHIHFPRRFTNWLRLARLLPYRAYFWLVHKVTGL